MFCLAEFALESILREGLEDMKSDTDLRLDDIFGRLRLPDIATKYGNDEISKIKKLLLRTPINIVQAQTNLMEMKMPAISIHLLADTESEAKASFNDKDGETSIPVDPEILVNAFTATSYDISTGKISVPDSVDLSDIYAGKVFVDGLGQNFKIMDPISNINGDKYFSITTDIVSITLTNCSIVQSIQERHFNVDYIPTDENIMIGVHAENSLLSKYLYYVVRYILYKKKNRFMEYQLQLSKYNGSDFAITQVFIPENGHSRWITAQFSTYNFWKGDELNIIDAVNPNVGGLGSFVEIVCDFVLSSYDSTTGLVTVADTVDLSEVQVSDWLFDGAGNIFKILGSIDNSPGNHSFRISPGQSLDLSAGCIKRKYTIRVEAESDREDEENYSWETDPWNDDN